MFTSRLSRLLPLFLAVAVLFSACSPAQPTVPSNQVDGAVATQVANMLIATQVASLLSATPSNSQPPVPLVTATPPAVTQPPLATATQPQPTTAPTDTPAPTATPTQKPSPTPFSGDPRNSLGNPTFQDKAFKENVNWGAEWKNDFTQGKFNNGAMVLTSVGVDGWTVSWPTIDDFYIEMNASTGDCGGMDRYGMIVRVPKTYDEGYLFGFTCDGRYSLRYWNPKEKQYDDLVKWTHSDYINAGSNESNRLGLKAEGNHFSLYANGHLLKEVVDENKYLSSGFFGPFIGHVETNDFTIYIHEISYWDLSE